MLKYIAWSLFIGLYILYVPLIMLLADGVYEAIPGIAGLSITQWILAYAIDEIIE